MSIHLVLLLNYALSVEMDNQIVDLVKSLTPLSRTGPKVKHPTRFETIEIEVVDNSYITGSENSSDDSKNGFGYALVFSKSMGFTDVHYTRLVTSPTY